jgi:hypothetical protein
MCSSSSTPAFQRARFSTAANTASPLAISSVGVNCHSSQTSRRVRWRKDRDSLAAVVDGRVGNVGELFQDALRVPQRQPPLPPLGLSRPRELSVVQQGDQLGALAL